GALPGRPGRRGLSGPPRPVAGGVPGGGPVPGRSARPARPPRSGAGRAAPRRILRPPLGGRGGDGGTDRWGPAGPATAPRAGAGRPAGGGAPGRRWHGGAAALVGAAGRSARLRRGAGPAATPRAAVGRPGRGGRRPAGGAVAPAPGPTGA